MVLQHENEGSFDFAFVDADKVNYWSYHERLMKKGIVLMGLLDLLMAYNIGDTK